LFFLTYSFRAGEAARLAGLAILATTLRTTLRGLADASTFALMTAGFFFETTLRVLAEDFFFAGAFREDLVFDFGRRVGEASFRAGEAFLRFVPGVARFIVMCTEIKDLIPKPQRELKRLIGWLPQRFRL
jgi:hypothetical protein